MQQDGVCVGFSATAGLTGVFMDNSGVIFESLVEEKDDYSLISPYLSLQTHLKVKVRH